MVEKLHLRKHRWHRLSGRIYITQVAQIVWPNLYSNIPDLDKFSERIFFSNQGQTIFLLLQCRVNSLGVFMLWFFFKFSGLSIRGSTRYFGTS
jgi:hypothetical protein